MEQQKGDISFETLLCLYNQEVDTLKEKLLNGESWENLRTTRKNIAELGIALQNCSVDRSSKYPDSGNPAEFPTPEDF